MDGEEVTLAINWDVVTTITGSLATLAGIAAAVFPPAAPIALPIVAVSGAVFSYGTNKGGKSSGLDPRVVEKLIADALKAKNEKES